MDHAGSAEAEGLQGAAAEPGGPAEPPGEQSAREADPRQGQRTSSPRTHVLASHRRSLSRRRLLLLQVAPPSPTESKGSSAPPPKPPTPEEPRRPDSLLGRFERREHLKKANTLPSSVTGEQLHHPCLNATKDSTSF